MIDREKNKEVEVENPDHYDKYSRILSITQSHVA